MLNSTVLVPHITVLQLKSNNVLLTKQHKQHRALPWQPTQLKNQKQKYTVLYKS
jgi:hypothetical protein